MGNSVRILCALLVLLAGVSASVSFAQQIVPQVGPPGGGRISTPAPRLAAPIALPPRLPVMTPVPLATLAPVTQMQGRMLMPMMDSLAKSALGPKMALSSFPALPAKNARNTMTAGGVRHRESGTVTSIMYNTVSGCSSTVGYIFNVGCTIDFQLAYCPTTDPTSGSYNQCDGKMSLPSTADTYQDYYIDANSSTAQTVGCTYKPSTGTWTSTGTGCTNGSSYLASNVCTTDGLNAAHCPYGPLESLTLNNQGTVVLATYDVTKSDWVAVVYITVGSAQGLNTFSDAAWTTPNVDFTIPSSGTNTVFIQLDSAQYSHYYVIYIEDTSTYATCTGLLPATAGSAGLCNPNGVTGQQAHSSGTLGFTWTFGAGTDWTALTTGNYSLVAYDQTQGQTVAQTQISLTAASATVGLSITSVAGNTNTVPTPSPNPDGTAATRFAFNSTSDASDIDTESAYTGLTNGHKYCWTLSDPEARVFQDWNGVVTGADYEMKFLCETAGGTTMTIPHANINPETPSDFAANTYTEQLCDYSTTPCTIVSSRSYSLLGYHLTTDFTNSAGTTNVGNSLVVALGGTTTGGLMFTNDGDTYFGTGNGDTLAAVYYTTETGGTTGTGSTFTDSSCGAYPCTVTLSDSNSNSWYAYITQHGAGNTAYTTMMLCPTAWGTTCNAISGSQSLAMDADITVPNLTFAKTNGGTTCTGSNCEGPTAILPSDGQTWSTLGSSSAGDLTYFTNTSGTTYAGTGSFIHLGVVSSGCSSTGCTSGYNGTILTSPCTPDEGFESSGTVGAGIEQHGYYTNLTQALYAQNTPFTPTTGQADVYCIDVTNNSSAGKTITGLAFTLPATYAAASATIWSVDKNSPTAWTQDTTSGKCLASTNYCIKPTGSNTGVQSGASETIYLDVQGLPTSSFDFSDVIEQAYNPDTFSLTANTTCCTSAYVATVPVSSTDPTQTALDALTIGAYSLNEAYMTPLFNPTSEGTSTDNTVSISLKNTSTAQDTNPDFLDAVIFEFPNSTYLGTTSSNFTSLTSNWIYLGSQTPGVGGGTTIDYWFGLCNAQFVTADQPLSNPTSSTVKSLPYRGQSANCSDTVEQSAIAPGNTFSFNAPIQTTATAGTISAVAYAHGANGNGWSEGNSFSLTVTSTSATAGFSEVGTYGSPSAVPSNTTPQISTDSNTTYGNSYVYTITNTSGSGHNITSATITVPGKDASGSLPSDGTAWTITAAPTITGTTYSCSVSSYTSATTAGANGSIVIGGGSCSIPSGDTLTISFSAKGPYTVNDQYQFPTVVNSTINASEQWTGDTYVQIDLGATIVLTIAPTFDSGGDNSNGTALSPVCATCTYISGNPNQINFGNGLAANSTTTGTDIALVDVYTNAASPTGWDLYVSQSGTNATAAPYLETELDSSATKSYQPKTGVTLDGTTYASIPTTGTGTTLANTTGTAATRSPFEFASNFEIVIPVGGNTAANTSTITYTWISN